MDIDTFRVGILGVLVLAFPLPPLSSAAAEIRGTCEIAFRGSSALHDFSGTGRCASFTVPIEKDAAGRRHLPAVRVRVPVASLDTGNATRDARMRGMFEADRFADIEGTARDIDADRLRNAVRENPGGKATIPLTLAIRGIEKAATASVVAYRETRDRVVFDLELPVSLAAYNLKPPSILGIFRVGDTVRVRGTFTLDLPPGE